jgi:hypothetical protein
MYITLSLNANIRNLYANSFHSDKKYMTQASVSNLVLLFSEFLNSCCQWTFRRNMLLLEVKYWKMFEKN